MEVVSRSPVKKDERRTLTEFRHVEARRAILRRQIPGVLLELTEDVWRNRLVGRHERIEGQGHAHLAAVNHVGMALGTGAD